MTDDLFERFLSDAVLSYDTDDGSAGGPARWSAARDIRSVHPDITANSIAAAAVAADHQAMSGLLTADPALAHRRSGPKQWEPLLYLTYSRLDPQVGVADVLRCAQLLLDHGADPNAGFLLDDQPTPFTALTGVFGSGEGGPAKQPPHPHQDALGRLLLESGADPNDAQALYNRMFTPSDGHMELLFEYGLGSGNGGPWHRRNPEDTDTPVQMLRAQLAWAVTHGFSRRIGLLADHGVDLESPLDSGHLPMVTTATPMQLAMLAGRPESVAALADHGVSTDVDPVTALVGALLDADDARVATLASRSPKLVDEVRRKYPSLILRATATDQLAAVGLLARNGFDVNALGRSDVVAEHPWETALHHAAGDGQLEAARLLLRLGADPAARDLRFQGTPLDWARHLDRSALVALLEPVTPAR